MSRLNEAQDEMEKKANSFIETASETQEKAEQFYQNILGYIKKKPTSALILLLGVGFLIGKIL